MQHRARKFVVLCFALLALIGLVPTTAQAQPGPEVVEVCRDRVGAERACRTIEAFADGFAASCRNLGLTSPCVRLDGRKAGKEQLVKYRASWVHRALTLQRGIADTAPLARATIPHTHNSFNTPVYSPTLSTQDPNQLYSLRDQLQMDVRAIELDLHYVPSRFGKVRNAMHAVVLCHGEVIGGVHVGCSVDRWFRDGLKELRDWMLRAENRQEVVLLYLENNLDGNRNAHNLAADEIKAVLGDLVARPPAGKPCDPLDTSQSPARLRAAGHRVIIVGNCGPGRWGSWVHQRGPATNWEESSSGVGDDYPGLVKGCAAERIRTNAGTAIVRWYEDLTLITALADGRNGALTTGEAATMAKCGATLIGFDKLIPQDPRLAAIVWSWAPDAPAKPNGLPFCATSQRDTRFHDEPCGNGHAYACVTGTDTWNITKTAGEFLGGAVACQNEFPGSHFATPANGWENSLLRGLGGVATVWVNYADAYGSGYWRAVT